jgi:hypothetical protein
MTGRALPIPDVSDELPILLRAYVESELKEPRKMRSISGQHIQSASDWSVIIDCETKVDPGQALRVGFCRVYYRDELRRLVLFYADDLSGRDLKVVRRFARPGLEIMSHAEFIDKMFYKYAYHLRAMIIGFNLPFDLSRLAVSHASARGTMRGGFSLKLSPHNYQPPVQVKHLSKYVSMMRFAAPFVSPNSRSQLKHGKRNPHKRGYFLEVRALAAALFSRSFSLASLADFLGVAHGKLETDHHGKPLTRQYLEYAERDVLTTWECYRELCRRYEALELKSTPVHRIFSEASIGKANFVEMGIEPWFNVQQDIPRKLLAQILSTYFGGRSEVRIRRELRQVMLCDFLSMYPTVCTLAGLWPFVISKGMRWQNGTTEVKRILKTWTLHDLQEQANWRKLVALVQIIPDADIFPVRAEYKDGADGTIGANYLTNKTGLWFTLADCLAAQILSGKSVKVMQALIFKPGAAQPGLGAVAVSGNPDYLVDPYKEDFYKRMIELRQVVKGKRDLAAREGREADRTKFDVEQNALKIATNATSYGIFAEINVNDRAKKAASRVHTAISQSYVLDHLKDEQPGRYFHPLLATTITGAARLMLAITERLILNHGLEWAFCDTDSMAIAKPTEMVETEFYAKVGDIAAWFAHLNPYEFPGSILKIEDVNYSLENSKKREPLFVFAVSAKRYALFNIENDRPIIRKASAHGLGHFQAPYDKTKPAKDIPPPRDKLGKIGVELWHHDLWWLYAKAAIAGNPDRVELRHHPSLKKPAASRYAATTPRSLRWFDKYNEGLPYAEKVKPFGFVSAFSARTLISGPISKLKRKPSKANGQLKPVAPFDKNPVVAAQKAFDRITSESVSVDCLKRYEQALAQYHLHPEDKFQNADSLDRGITLRRHIRVAGIEYIGKESNKWEDQYYFGFDADEEIRYGNGPEIFKTLQNDLRQIVEAKGQRAAARKIGISRSKLSNLVEFGLSALPFQFVQRIAGNVGKLKSKQIHEEMETAALLKAARAEIQRTGISEFSRRLGLDSSNLAKSFAGKRSASRMMLRQVRAYFRGQLKAWK